MLFSHQNILFLHIPRCAGTAINKFLWKRFNPSSPFPSVVKKEDLNYMWGTYKSASSRIELDHCFFRHYIFFIGRHKIDALNSFCIVRDPFDRLVSIYKRASSLREKRMFITKSNPFGDNGDWSVNCFLECCEQSLLAFKSDQSFFKNCHDHLMISHFIPQTEFILDENDIPAVKFIVDISDLILFSKSRAGASVGMDGFTDSSDKSVKNSYTLLLSKEDKTKLKDFSDAYYTNDYKALDLAKKMRENEWNSNY